MKNNIKKITFLIAGLFLAASASYLNAWSGPPTGTTPPDKNVDAPVNVGASNQSKSGVLGVGGLSVVGVGQVSASNYLLPVSLTFGVNGKVGATQYCDEKGNNCSSSVGGSGSSVPAGAVMAFNLTTCPAGWVLADGNNGTKDLKGSFIRGYGTSAAGTAASGAFGVFQNDAFKSHIHTGSASSGGDHTHPYTSGNLQDNKNFQVGSGRWVGTPGVAANITSSGAHTHPVSITENTDGGSTETRPDNVALLFCQKS